MTDCYEGQGFRCGGLANPISDDLYGDPRSCCVADLPWMFVEFCEVSLVGPIFFYQSTVHVPTILPIAFTRRNLCSAPVMPGLAYIIVETLLEAKCV